MSATRADRKAHPEPTLVSLGVRVGEALLLTCRGLLEGGDAVLVHPVEPVVTFESGLLLAALVGLRPGWYICWVELGVVDALTFLVPINLPPCCA